LIKNRFRGESGGGIGQPNLKDWRKMEHGSRHIKVNLRRKYTWKEGSQTITKTTIQGYVGHTHTQN